MGANQKDCCPCLCVCLCPCFCSLLLAGLRPYGPDVENRDEEEGAELTGGRGFGAEECVRLPGRRPIRKPGPGSLGRFCSGPLEGGGVWDMGADG